MTSKRSPQYLRQILRSYQQASTHASTEIFLAGSFTLDSLIPYIKGHFLEEGVTANIEAAPFNQVLQFCRRPESYIDTTAPPDTICLIWRIEDLFPRALENTLYGEPFLAELKNEIDLVIEDVRRIREWYQGTIIVSNPPFPQFPGFATHEVGMGEASGRIFRDISQYWSERAATLPLITTVDLQGLLLQQGITSAHDARKWYMYRQPYSENFLARIAWMITRTVLAQKRSARKCIVLDCDNTLWGGIIGEDGIAGIQLGDDFPGSVYRDFQFNLKYLHQRGILLAVASKNNPDDVMSVFNGHDAMVLRSTHISRFEIGWDSKVDSLRRIAKALNIGVDSLVFIDDSMKEIDEVRQRLPEVACIQVPEEIVDLPEILGDSGLFDQMQITGEDRQRSRMMHEEHLRGLARSSLTENEFKSSLALRISVFEAQPQHVARVTQLVNKTNQFNLTTVRRSQSEIEALIKSSRYRVLAVDVSDKYGDYGLVGVAILEQQNGGRWFIDTLLLSCRVLGRDIEKAFISAIAEIVAGLGGTELIGRFVPTAKNAQAGSFYADHGFRPDSHTGDWLAHVTAIKALSSGFGGDITLHTTRNTEALLQGQR